MMNYAEFNQKQKLIESILAKVQDHLRKDNKKGNMKNVPVGYTDIAGFIKRNNIKIKDVKSVEMIVEEFIKDTNKEY